MIYTYKNANPMDMAETPYSEHFDDIYFCVEDGLNESRYVFLEQNHLPDRWMDCSQFKICETGFGTGLNFLLTWELFERTARPNQKLIYYSFEKFPLSPEQIQTYLKLWSGEFNGRLEKLVSLYPRRIGGWHRIDVSKNVTLILIFDDVNRALPELKTPVDCWYLDGHAPAENPDMWGVDIYQHMARLSKHGARFATFTAAGHVRRGLREAGFEVQKIKGFGRKRDMSIGVFTGEHKFKSNKNSSQNIAIIGAGIAGAACAYRLREKNIACRVFEKKSIAAMGSGNMRGLCNPRITTTRGPEADFYGPAFQRALELIKDTSSDHDIGRMHSGSIHLMGDDAKGKRFRGFVENWGWHPDHVRYVDKHEVSDIAGIPVLEGGLYMPDSISVSPFKLTHVLLAGLDVLYEEAITLKADSDGWLVNGQSFDAVILAGGHDVLQFPQVSMLPLQKIRGQVTLVKPTTVYERLKTNLCYSGYASVAVDGQAVIGSTFQNWIDDDAIIPTDDDENLMKLACVSPVLADGLEIIGARASFRCAAHDRAPVIGQVKDCKNLYMSTGHGSHGIVSSILAADYLVGKICGDAQILPHSLEKYMSPARFKVLRDM